MTWNYRVIEYVDPTTREPWFAMHEVYYSGDKPLSYTKNPVGVVGDSVEEMRDVLRMMRAALDKPALREIDFQRAGRGEGGAL